MKASVIVLLILTLFAGLLLGNYIQDSSEDESIEELQFGENTIILNFRDNVFNVTDTEGDYTRLNTANHTITSYNSTYDVKMYWWCNQSNWTLVTE